MTKPRFGAVSRLGSWILGVALVLLAAACTTRTVTPSGGSSGAGYGGTAGIEPSLAVERFLQAANADDWDTMGRIFGTKDGSFRDQIGDRQEVELRMNAIALILKHEDFEIVAQNRAPGRENPTVRIGVDITVEPDEIVRDVGFFVVQSNSGPWLVEEIELVKLTAS